MYKITGPGTFLLTAGTIVLVASLAIVLWIPISIARKIASVINRK